MKTQKVCITTLEFPPDIGQCGEQIHSIAQMLLDSGYEVHVAVFHSKQRKTNGDRRSERETIWQDGVYVHRLKCAVRSETPLIQDCLSEIYAQLKHLHQQFNFDLLHAFFISETGFLTALLALEYRIPVISSIRGSDLHRHVFSAKQLSQMTWTLNNSTWATFVSQDLKHRASVLVPGLEERSSVFWNSIRPVDFDQLPVPEVIKTMWSNPSTGIVVGSVGRFRDKKGLEFLLDACAELSPEIELTLLLVGDFAERERTYWEQEVQNSSIANRIIVTGMVERTQGLAYLPHIDIFTIPSLHDDCPNALLEAMLAGKAIVGTHVDAIGEILEDGTDALVIEPGSSPALASAIRQLARSPQLRQYLGSAAQIKVSQQLCPEIEQANWVKVYQQILGNVRVPEMALA
ncbi:MAG: glycosyltransferase family 4 protein [Cyanothece sp. SIO1E1]|nr:glycosyltransferase family 4 protein [Cyanothece sp. SIO1E1]